MLKGNIIIKSIKYKKAKSKGYVKLKKLLTFEN